MVTLTSLDKIGMDKATRKVRDKGLCKLFGLNLRSSLCDHFVINEMCNYNYN